MGKVIGTCLVRKELRKQQKVLNKKKWETVRDKLQKEHCGFDTCLLCPHLKMKWKK